MSVIVEKEVVIVGGGPAGMVLGLLLAHAGVETLVLEMHPNFDREFRGEVLQPMFVQMMRQIGLDKYIESFPHSKLSHGEFFYKNKLLGRLEFNKMAPDVPYAMWMPQPILLNALYEKAKTLPKFDMWFSAPVKQLIQNGDEVQGIHTMHEGQPVEVRAKVTVGSDGRFSSIRRLAGFEFSYEHYENDVVWFMFDRNQETSDTFRFLLSDKHNYLVLPKYPDKIQAGVTLKHGEWAEFREKGIDALRTELLAASDAFKEFATNLTDFSPFTLLQAKIHEVKDWATNGCVLIGDAAHCSSPVGAIGVSLAVGTAIVAAHVIRDAILADDCSAQRLSRIQELRMDDISRVHHLQLRAEETVLSQSPVFKSMFPVLAPLILKTPLAQVLQRKVFILANPLPIDAAFVFHA